MWNLPGPGIELISPVSQGKFLTTGPPGKPFPILLFVILNMRSVSRLPSWSSGYDSVFPLQGAQIWSLFRELRSCMLCRTAKLIIITVKLFLLFYLKSVSCKRAIVGSCFFNPTWQCNDWLDCLIHSHMLNYWYSLIYVCICFLFSISCLFCPSVFLPLCFLLYWVNTF